MCLAVPALLVKCDGGEAMADLHGTQVQISTALVPEAGVGDWVLIHAGFAIKKLDKGELEDTWAVLEDLAQATAATPTPTPALTRSTGRGGKEEAGR